MALRLCRVRSDGSLRVGRCTGAKSPFVSNFPIGTSNSSLREFQLVTKSGMISNQGRKTVRSVTLKLKQNNWWQAIDSSIERKQSSLLGRASEKHSTHQGHPDKARAGGPSNFRSRAQLDGRRGDGEGVQRKHLLKPYDLSVQLKRLCSEGDLDGAIERLKSTPRDAQNTAVWNTMISECLSAERYQLSYDLFVDVSRSVHLVCYLSITGFCNR